MASYHTYKLVENNLYTTSSFELLRSETTSRTIVDTDLKRTTESYYKSYVTNRDISFKEYSENFYMTQVIIANTIYTVNKQGQKGVVKDPVFQVNQAIRYAKIVWGTQENMNYGDVIKSDPFDFANGYSDFYTINGLSSVQNNDGEYLLSEIPRTGNSTSLGDVLSKTYFLTGGFPSWSYFKIKSVIPVQTEITDLYYYDPAFVGKKTEFYTPSVDINAQFSIMRGAVLKQDLYVDTNNAILASFETKFAPEKRFHTFIPKIIKDNKTTIWFGSNDVIENYLRESTVVSSNTAVPVQEVISKQITLREAFDYTSYIFRHSVTFETITIYGNPDMDYLEVTTEKRIGARFSNITQKLEEKETFEKEVTSSIPTQNFNLRTYTTMVRGFYDITTYDIDIKGFQKITWTTPDALLGVKKYTSTLAYPVNYTVYTEDKKVEVPGSSTGFTQKVNAAGNQIAQKTRESPIPIGDANTYQVYYPTNIKDQRNSGFVLGYKGIQIQDQFYSWVSLSISPKIKIQSTRLFPYIKPGIKTIMPIVDQNFTMTSENKEIIGTINIRNQSVFLKWLKEIDEKTTTVISTVESTTEFKFGGTKYIDTIPQQFRVQYMSLIRAGHGGGFLGNLGNNAQLSPTYFGSINNDNLTHYVFRNPYIFYDIKNKKTVLVEERESFSYDSKNNVNNNLIPYPFVFDTYARRRNSWRESNTIFGYQNKWIVDPLPMGTYITDNIY